MMKTIKFAILTIIILAAVSITAYAEVHTRAIPTSGGDRNVTWVQVSLDSTYSVSGLTARGALGRATGTLTEFANAASSWAGSNTVIFPANFFHAYGGAQANQIIGGIVSGGQIVNNSYFSWGAGFDADNNFSLFSGHINNGRLVDWSHNPLDQYVTAFNPYPHLVEHGQRLTLAPGPGITQAWLNQRAFRAFMGQRADGSFVVANIPNANMLEVQDVAMYMGMVTAVNIDGGSSVGIWHNGDYVTRPGRALASVVFITNNYATGTTAQPPQAPQPEIGVYVNGRRLDFDVAPIIVDNRTMVPMRAIFEAMGMGVEWNQDTRTAIGTRGNLSINISIDSPTAIVSDSGNAEAVLLDAPAILHDGRTLVPVRFIAEASGADVEWNDAAQSVIITANFPG